MTARAQRFGALSVGLCIGVVFALIAAVQIAGWTVGSVEHTSSQVITGPVDKLVVEADGGELTVMPSLNDEVRIRSTVRGSIHTPTPVAYRDGNTVQLTGRCPDISFGPCSARITISVPIDTPVEVHSSSSDLNVAGLSGRVQLQTGSGDVTATNLSGPVTLDTASGNISVRDAGGVAHLQTGSGDINGEGLGGSEVTADTASGDVALDFSHGPHSVTATTGSGDVDLSVPRGSTYRVEADPGSGDQQIDVRTDPAASSTLRASTASGDVTVGYRN